MTVVPQTNQLSKKISNAIKARAKSLGFCLCGITTTEPLEDYPRYENWLASGCHGSMGYLATERHRVLRQEPQKLAPWARSIIVLAWPYPLNRSLPDDPNGQIAGYVDSEDYHTVLPRILQPLVDELPVQFGRPVHAQIFCDSAPILERELASRAGLGWIGRNSCLINPKFGSAFLLADVFLDCELTTDEPYSTDRCGNCHRCVDACPAGCILPNRTIDANRCISALTIELKGEIPQPLNKTIGNHVFGCDICQSVCPWNKSVPQADPRSTSLSEQDMMALLEITEEDYRVLYQGTALSRAKRVGLLRNLCIVLGNLGSKTSLKKLENLLFSDTNLSLRATAATALLSIDPPTARKVIMDCIQKEQDPLLKSELEELVN